MNKIKILCLAIVLGLLLVGCQMSSDKQKSKSINDGASLTESLHSSPSAELTLEKLVKRTGLIIVGTVEAIVEKHEQYPMEVLPQLVKVDTDYSIKVSRVLKSDSEFSDQAVIVNQPEGTWNDGTLVFEGNKPFEIGEDILLFLTDISDDPIRTRQGQTKYSLDARFKINSDGSLDVSAMNWSGGKQYQGKSKTELENAILSFLPTESDYLETLYPTFLVVEGIVTEQSSRLFKNEDDELVATIYNFQVEHVIHDDIEHKKAQAHRNGVYGKSPVKQGDVIKIYENGGTYGDITQRHAWSQGMEPGARMLLFLGGSDCRNTLIHICTQEEKNGAQAMYTLGLRFIVEPDGTLQGVGRSYLSRFYNAKSLETIEIDFANALRRWEQESQRMTQPDPAIPTPRPPPLPTSDP